MLTNGKFQFDKRVTWTAAEFNYNGNGGAQQSSLPLVTLYGSEVTCDDCFAYAGVGLEFQLVVISAPMRGVVLAVTLMSLTADGTLTVGADINANFKRKDRASRRNKQLTNTMNIGSVSFQAGPVPVSITGYCTLYADYSFSSDARGKASIGFDYSKYVEFGLSYRSRDGAVRIVKSNPTATFNYRPLTVDVTGKMSASLKLIPELKFKLWNTIPLLVRPGLKVGVDAILGAGSSCSNPKSPHFETWVGMDLKVGLEKIKTSFFSSSGLLFFRGILPP